MAEADPLTRADRALLGDGAHDLVATWLSRDGDHLRSLVTRQVLRQPRRRTIVRWNATTDDGRRIAVVGVAHRAGLPSGIDVVAVADTHVGLFRVPHDPGLPALASLRDATTASDLLARPVTGVRRRRYRPLTRAVVEVTLADGTTWWAKVVPPRRAHDLAAVHERCGAVVGGPEVVHRDLDTGLVVLSHVPGHDLRSRLRREGSPLPEPDDVLALSQRLAGVTSPSPVRRTPPLDGIDRTVERLCEALPDVAALAATVAARLPAPVPGPTAGPTVHGDLHSAQVMVGEGRVTGLIDLDDAGAGDRADDLSRFLGHLICTTDRDDAAWARPWTRHWHAAVAEVVEPSVLQPRVAAVLLSLALGPYRVHRDGWQERTRRRLDLADHWSRRDRVPSPWP